MRSVVVLLTFVVALAGLTPLAVAQTSDVLVLEGLKLPQGHQYEIYNAATKTYSKIDVRDVPAYYQKKTAVYDRTAKVWVVNASGHLDQRYAAAAPAAKPGTGSAAQKPSGEWQRIHGKVESVQGTTLSFKADDGRQLSVDVSKVDAKIRQSLTQGEGVTVIGHEWVDAKTLRANYVQQDSSDPSHGGKVTPSASPSTKTK